MMSNLRKKFAAAAETVVAMAALGSLVGATGTIMADNMAGIVHPGQPVQFQSHIPENTAYGFEAGAAAGLALSVGAALSDRRKKNLPAP